MKIALQLGLSASQARFARQLGLRHVVHAVPPGTSGVLALEDLRRAREFFAQFGLAFDVIENLPTEHYYKAMFGLPGRDEQIEKVQTTIRNMGQVGIPVLQYQWMLLGGLRSEYSPTGRGGSRVARFDQAVCDRAPMACQVWRGPNGMIHLPDAELSAEDVWQNLLYFLRGIAPAAEEAGVKLAVHPDDPPIPSFMGVARIMTSLDGFQRLIDSMPSPNVGLGFCQGTISAMPGVDIPQAIRRFGGQGRIFFAHFRNSVGRLPYFDEVFPDEGDTDLYECVRAYNDVGFDGVMRIDHSPGVADDNPTGDRGFGMQTGYAKALVDADAQLRSGVLKRRVARGWRSAPPGPRLQLAVVADCFDDYQIMMAQQMGVTQIVAEPKGWEAPTLAAMANRVQKAGLQLVGVDDLPPEMYAKAILGQPGRHVQIENVCQAIRQVGAAGIRLLSYGWTAPGVGGDETVEVRGGARARLYGGQAASEPDAGPDVEHLWYNLEYFLQRVLPVAEAAGVRLAFRPDAPSDIQGQKRGLFGSPEALDRLLALSASAAHGLDLHHGAVAGMPGVALLDVIGRVGAQERILMVTLEARQRSAEGWAQGFLDEDSLLLRALLAYRQMSYTGPIRAARPPRLEGDAAWGAKGRALDIGYVRALIQMAERLD